MEVIAHPPVIELVIGVQFSRLENLTVGHYGLFWERLGADWSLAEDAPPIEERFESFEGPLGYGSNAPEIPRFVSRGLTRLLVHHRSGDRLIQIQPTRFHLNWRKRHDAYPSFAQLVGEFENILNELEWFVRDKKLGALALNQWEITYVDAFPRGQVWDSPHDWDRVLPGMFSPSPEIEGMPLDRRQAELVFEIAPRRGRLYVSAGMGAVKGDENVYLLMHTTARGPLKERGELRVGLDLGHEAALKVFRQVVSDEILANFMPKEAQS